MTEAVELGVQAKSEASEVLKTQPDYVPLRAKPIEDPLFKSQMSNSSANSMYSLTKHHEKKQKR